MIKYSHNMSAFQNAHNPITATLQKYLQMFKTHRLQFQNFELGVPYFTAYGTLYPLYPKSITTNKVIDNPYANLSRAKTHTVAKDMHVKCIKKEINRVKNTF